MFRDNGGLIVESGPASPDCGVFSRSETRKRLYESKKFKPTHGLVLWPRDAMIAWAAAHPEWADRAGGPDCSGDVRERESRCGGFL